MNPDTAIPTSTTQIVEWCRVLSESGMSWPILGLPQYEYADHVPPDERARMTVWHYGERIRQAFVAHPQWRKDTSVMDGICGVIAATHWGSGRAPFVKLLRGKSDVDRASRLAPFLNDSTIDGHVIWSLRRMRAPGFIAEVAPFLKHPKAWIRREARGYLMLFPEARRVLEAETHSPKTPSKPPSG